MNLREKTTITITIIVAAFIMLGCIIPSTVNQMIVLTEPIAGDSIFKVELVDSNGAVYKPLATDTDWSLNFSDVLEGQAILNVITTYGQVYEIPVDVTGVPFTVSLSSVKSSRIHQYK